MHKSEGSLDKTNTRLVAMCETRLVDKDQTRLENKDKTRSSPRGEENIFMGEIVIVS